MISNSGSDEHGSYHGGKAGDQTEKEWRLRSWYNRPWNCVLRHPDVRVRNMLSEMSIQAANNNHVGYDQWQRTTYWTALSKVNYIPANITTDCEADCSSGVMSNVRGVGYRLTLPELQNVPITTTNYMRAELKKVGFQVLTDKKYLTSDDYLVPGDILLNDNKHTAVNVTFGKYAVDLTSVQQFVARMYKVVLKRNYDEGGYNYWVNAIVNKTSTPSQVAYGFFFSSEFINLKLSNSEYVNRLYSALLNRKPDEGGKAHWIKQLEANKRREFVFNGFVNSTEWHNLLKSYNLE